MVENRTYVYSWENIWYTINMDKNIFTIRENDLSYGRGYVYSLQYHLVWCTKYRKKVLQNGLDEECKKMLYEIADEYKFQIVAMEVMPDHIHLLVDCKPQFYISDMIKIIKGNLARQLFLSHPELKRELWGGHLWNPSYCAVQSVTEVKNRFLLISKDRKKKKQESKEFLMKVVSSYGVEIKKQNIPIRHTLYIYRQAVGYLIRVYEESWEELSRIVNLQKRFNAAEHLVHSTKKNRVRYDFDQKFPKMPSYLRRSAIQHALGSVSSYETRLELWKQKKLAGKPKLVYENHAMPVFYRDVMYKEAEDQTDRAFLKLYDGHDWKWFSVNLLHTDMEYLRENWSG